MNRATGGGFGSAVAWLIFPLVPALLGNSYYQLFQGPGNDPLGWGWVIWVVLTGPLLGYGFLAGATLDLADERGRRGLRGWLASRSVWVAVGPWVGFLYWVILYYAFRLASAVVDWAYPPSRGWHDPLGLDREESWMSWVLTIVLVGSLAYGWLFVAIAASRRARRAGRLRQALRKGVALAIAFVGSLIGSFWAITEAWRSYFFDPRVFPVLVALWCAAVTSGCAAPMTYGEVRRGELFQAMLMAWLLGLALLWRWWSRPRSKPPDPPAEGRSP
jgi:hypothetical protein